MSKIQWLQLFKFLVSSEYIDQKKKRAKKKLSPWALASLKICDGLFSDQTFNQGNNKQIYCNKTNQLKPLKDSLLFLPDCGVKVIPSFESQERSELTFGGERFPLSLSTKSNRNTFFETISGSVKVIQLFCQEKKSTTSTLDYFHNGSWQPLRIPLMFQI